MDIDIVIKNYRCFADSNPARFGLRPGLSSFVGLNNSGKSSILRFFYEMRQLFHMLDEQPDHYSVIARGGSYGLTIAPTGGDPREVFCNSNERDMEVELRLRGLSQPNNEAGLPYALGMLFRVQRS